MNSVQPSAATVQGRRSNPFATRFIKPGAIPYRFLELGGWADLESALAQHAWRGQLIGPHGCGKSTLLADWLPRMSFPEVHYIRCGTSGPLEQSRHQHHDPMRGNGRPEVMQVIDGFDHLPRVRQWASMARARSMRQGLIVTCHRPRRMGFRHHLGPSLETAIWLVDWLQREGPKRVGPQDVERTFHDVGGNMREMLFRLYDVYAERETGGLQPTTAPPPLRHR